MRTLYPLLKDGKPSRVNAADFLLPGFISYNEPYCQGSSERIPKAFRKA